MSSEDIKKDYGTAGPVSPSQPYSHDGEGEHHPYSDTQPHHAPTGRPPLDYTSTPAFLSSVGRRFKSLWTRRFVLSLLAGQAVALCITCTNVTTTELVSRGWALPTTQSVFLYFALFIIYTPYTMYQYGMKGWAKMVLRDGWKYIILAACDVEANFMVVKAYQYSNLLSCMLLNAWATPVCMFFSWVYMRPRYRWSQILGVLVCIGGLGMLVASDQLTNKDYVAANVAKGNGLMLAGATLYGFTNATEEFFVRNSPLYEVVGQLGMWGFIICMSQAAGLEHKDWMVMNWDGAVIGLIVAFTAAMLILYTVAPILYRMASSTFYNISLLASNFYGLLFGLFLYNYDPYWLYFVSFVVVIVGLVVYFWTSPPEEQGKIEPKAPAYVQRKHGVDGGRAVGDV
ncbi:DUF914-domain-containing protein [Pterulicium gracile]|uniref:DUF914-domain-containing protein n=1 Tax=Pterulicium gracile TaxID=1884261 RepID=A0A5C3QJ51_9AGAR|nr:DUF914-domain-containing protein [Pterula gracilis]